MKDFLENAELAVKVGVNIHRGRPLSSKRRWMLKNWFDKGRSVNVKAEEGEGILKNLIVTDERLALFRRSGLCSRRFTDFASQGAVLPYLVG